MNEKRARQVAWQAATAVWGMAASGKATIADAIRPGCGVADLADYLDEVPLATLRDLHGFAVRGLVAAPRFDQAPAAVVMALETFRATYRAMMTLAAADADRAKETAAAKVSRAPLPDVGVFRRSLKRRPKRVDAGGRAAR